MLQIQITFRPIDRWPGERTPSYSRKRSSFKASYRSTMDLLNRELAMLRASNVVIQLDTNPGEIRRDGLPRADAHVTTPAVILAFETKGGAVSFPCDKYNDWEDNLRAIALSLEALRSVDRHGVTRNGEQYRGWAALPDKRGESVAWLKTQLGIDFNGQPPDGLKPAIRTAAIKQFHPDRNCGDVTKWNRWVEAASALGIEI